MRTCLLRNYKIHITCMTLAITCLFARVEILRVAGQQAVSSRALCGLGLVTSLVLSWVPGTDRT